MLRSLIAIVVVVGAAFAQESSTAPQALPAANATIHQVSAADLQLDPHEIVRRSLEVDHHNFERARNYTCRQREVSKEIDKHGAVKSTTIKTYDINFYYGEIYSRMTQKNDQPLSASDQKKEDEKLEKFLSKLRNQSDEERQKRLAKEKKEREEARAFLRDVVNAYDFKLLGEGLVNGVDAWVIEATPRKGFHPTQPHADMLSKIKGRIWIEKTDYNWVKVDAESIDTMSFGLFLFRIHKGAHLAFEQVHLNDEVWLIHKLFISGGARIALLKNENIEQEDEFTNYQKFSASTRILPGVREVPADPPK